MNQTAKLSTRLSFGEEVANSITHAVGAAVMLALLPVTAIHAYNSFVTCMAEEEGEIPPLIQSACQTLKSYYLTHQILAELEKEDPHESNR